MRHACRDHQTAAGPGCDPPGVSGGSRGGRTERLNPTCLTRLDSFRAEPLNAATLCSHHHNPRGGRTRLPTRKPRGCRVWPLSHPARSPVSPSCTSMRRHPGKHSPHEASPPSSPRSGRAERRAGTDRAGRLPAGTRTHRSGESLLRIRRMTALRGHTKRQLHEKIAAFCSRGSIPTPARQPQLREHSGRHRCWR